MDRAIWAISYGIDPARFEEYLAWFHGTHIPEKLARPGHVWAAHYRSFDNARHLALFGGRDAGAFLSPTPGQIKPTQGALTREMMGLRVGASAAILNEVVRIDGPAVDSRAAGTVPGSFVRFAHYDLPGVPEQDAAGAWLAQQRFTRIAASAGAIAMRLMQPLIGAGRHAVLEEYASAEAMRGLPAEFAPGAMHGPGSPFEGRRIWPA
jgi:hypothetical protein